MAEDLNALSVSELKKKLQEFGEGTSDCFEKSDLIDKLRRLQAQGTAKAKATASSNTEGDESGSRAEAAQKASGEKYGRVAYAGNKKSPKGIMVIMHGLGDSCDGWADTAEHMASSHPDLLFILPTAPTIPVSLNMKMPMPAWYDIISMNPMAAEDDKRMTSSAEYVKGLVIDNCKKYNVPQENVIYGGFSQGSVIALHAGLTAVPKPKGVLMMSGYFGGKTSLPGKVLSDNKDVPLLMCHGTSDPMIPLQAAQLSQQAFTGMIGLSKVEFKQYPGMAHSACAQEIADITAWVRGLGF